LDGGIWLKADIVVRPERSYQLIAVFAFRAIERPLSHWIDGR
jgi:hypothetical protein